MKKIIFILLSIFSILSFSDEYKIIADYNVKISKTEQENSSVEIEYYASKWDVITKNIQNVIKEIRFLTNKKVLSIVTIISPDPENFTSKKLDEEAAKRYKQKTGKSIETLKNQKLSEEETKKTIADFNSAMAEVVDEKLAATVKYSYVDYTVELIKKGNSWEILDIKQLNK